MRRLGLLVLVLSAAVSALVLVLSLLSTGPRRRGCFCGGGGRLCGGGVVLLATRGPKEEGSGEQGGAAGADEKILLHLAGVRERPWHHKNAPLLSDERSHPAAEPAIEADRLPPRIGASRAQWHAGASQSEPLRRAARRGVEAAHRDVHHEADPQQDSHDARPAVREER